MTTYINPISADITPAQAAKRLSNKDLAAFHAFNPNGIAAEWSNLSSRLLAHGRGYLAYGDIGYFYNRLSELSRYDRKRVGRIQLEALLSCIRRNIDAGEAFLAAETAQVAA